MARKVEKSEDQKIWEIMCQFWRGMTYSRWGQLSNGHRNKHSPEYKCYTEELQALAERGLVAFDNETQQWDWTKAGGEWVNTFLASQKSGD